MQSTLWLIQPASLIDLLATWWTNMLPEWLTVWLIDWLADWLTDWLTGWLTDWLTGWLTDCLTDWLTDWLNNWLTDLLTDWMHSWLVDWLWTKIYTGWMICCKFHITIHPSQFLVQRTLCTLQLYVESLRKRFTTESNELSLDC